MSKEAKIFWTIIAIVVIFILVVWFLTQVLEILRANPEPLWFVLGMLSVLAVEGLVYLGIILKRKYWP
jgi:hypothetical protein